MTELAKKIEEVGNAFHAFKAANDERLKEIEKKGSADPLLVAQVDKINAAITDLTKEKDRLDKIEAALNRGEFNGGGSSDEDKAKTEHKAGFNAYFRKGRDAGLRELEVNAKLTTQIDEDGGFIVPEEVDKNIERVLGTMSAMRKLARIQPVGSATFKKMINTGGSTSGWVGEEQARAETSTPKLIALEFVCKELYAEPATTQTMLEDAMFDVAAWLSEEVGIEFSEQEGNAFILGDGVSKPRGILAYPTVANSSYAWGKVGFIASGAAGAFAATNPADKLIDVQHSLKAGYRQNAAWLMNDLTLAEVRKLKDGQGNYLWRPGLQEGAPDLILGKGVETDDNMPDIAANSFSIAFGDYRRAYIITDRRGTRVLRDDLTDKPNVKFYTTKRVGGGIQNFAALKLMKFA